jgi:hypothetical protein
MATVANVLGVEANTALHGEVVTWDVEKTECSYETVKEALVNAGLDPAAAVELRPRSAFSRACRHLKAERAIDKLEVEGGVASFQFSKKYLDDGKWAYDYECRVSLDLDTGVIECPENPELEQQARELFAFALKTRNTSDITNLVQKLFKDNADLFPINPKKGVAYFVLEAHREFTARVADFLKAIGGDLARFPVPKGDAVGNKSVKEAVTNGLAAVLGELDEAVGSWDETTRKSTMDRAFEKWQKVSYKVDAYAEYLESEQDGLRRRLAAAKAELARKVAGVEEAKEAKAAAAKAAKAEAGAVGAPVGAAAVAGEPVSV